MNLIHMRKLRSLIADLPAAMCDMEHWSKPYWTPTLIVDTGLVEPKHPCGSICCLGGWAQYLAETDLDFMAMLAIRHGSVFLPVTRGAFIAREYLGLSLNEADNLFYSFPDRPDGEWQSWMLARLDAMIAAGGYIWLHDEDDDLELDEIVIDESDESESELEPEPESVV